MISYLIHILIYPVVFLRGELPYLVHLGAPKVKAKVIDEGFHGVGTE